MHCNCRIRPLSHFIATLSDLPDNLNAITCLKPNLLEGHRLAEVPDAYMGCDPGDAIQATTNVMRDFGRLPDLRFHEIF